MSSTAATAVLRDAPASAAPLLLYDGDCGLCTRSVQWILDHDVRPHRGGDLRFAPIQGATAAPILARHGIAPSAVLGWETMVLVLDPGGPAERVVTYSDSVLSVARYLGGPWRLLATLGWLAPRPLRDAAYKLVARNRLRIAGPPTHCRRPSKAERARFLT